MPIILKIILSFNYKILLGVIFDSFSISIFNFLTEIIVL